MAWLKYYEDEQKRHAGLHVAPITFYDACDALWKLAAEHEIESGVKHIERTSGSRMSHYSPRKKTIRLNCDHLNWLTVIHEFAHALTYAEFDVRWKTWARGGQNDPEPRRGKWHDADHAEMVDMLARKVVDAGWLGALAADRAARVQRDLARIDKKVQRAALANDPAVVRAKRIEKRRVQVARLTTRLKALTTRLRTARRSLAALERAASKVKP